MTQQITKKLVKDLTDDDVFQKNKYVSKFNEQFIFPDHYENKYSYCEIQYKKDMFIDN